MPRHRILPFAASLAPLDLACMLAGCGSGTAAPPVAAAEPVAVDEGLVAHGEYIVRIAGCNDCHTPAYGENQGKVPKEHWLTGSPLGFNGPWGTTYPTNLRLRMQDFSEDEWLAYSANLRTRPLMPDFAVRDMTEDDRRALYRLVRSLGPVADKAPDYLPPGKTPPAPYLQLVLPPAPPAATAAPVAAG